MIPALGSLFGGKAFEKVAETSHRSKKEPYIMLSTDRLIIHSASAISFVVLALAIFLGEDMYHADGLYMLHPHAKETFIIQYCWANLQHYDELTGEVVSLPHYAYFPYIMFLFSALFYLVHVTWRTSGFNELANILDHILDGLEEQLRDILLFFREDIKGDHAKVSNPRTMSRAEIDGDNNNDNGPLLQTTSELVHEEDGLAVRLNKLQQDRKAPKYKYFNYLLEKCLNSKRQIRKITYRRTAIYILLLLVMAFISVIYLQPSLNPTLINCVLPIYLRSSDDINTVSINDTVQILFTPVPLRTNLMWMAVSFYIVVFFFANYCWLINRHKDSPGMLLLRNIGSDESHNIIQKLDKRESWFLTDLELLMDLVYVNRYRLTFIEIAFTTLFASNVKSEVKEDEYIPGQTVQAKHHRKKQAFLSVLRESVFWQVDGRKEDKFLDELARQINDNIN